MRKVVSFRCYPYFWELTKVGKKPFDVRFYDPNDERFQLLEKDWRQISIELVNSETGQKIRRPVKGYAGIKCSSSAIGNWVFIYF